MNHRSGDIYQTINKKVTNHDTNTLLTWVRKQKEVPVEVIRLMDDISEAHADYLDSLHEKLRIDYERECLAEAGLHDDE